MEYLTVKEVSQIWGITERMINYHCTAGRIPGALRRGKMWFIPIEAEKPIDGRTKEAKEMTNRE